MTESQHTQACQEVQAALDAVTLCIRVAIADNLPQLSHLQAAVAELVVAHSQAHQECLMWSRKSLLLESLLGDQL